MKKGHFRGVFEINRVVRGCPIGDYGFISCDYCIYWFDDHCVNFNDYVILPASFFCGHHVTNRYEFLDFRG